MKRTAALLAAVLIVSVVAAPVPAYAAGSKIKVSAKARTLTKAGKTTKVVFKTRMTKPGRVKVSIYRDGKRIRTIKPSGTWYRKSVTWNLRDAKGNKVKAGSYTYRVTATRRNATAAKRGVVRVKRPAQPAPSAPAPSDPAPSDPASGTAPGTETTAAPAPAPASNGRFIGFYIPGVPTYMEELGTVESAIGAEAGVVNFFISDRESFPTTRCNNVAAVGAVPLVTLEFWSIGDKGLSAIIDGDKDAYLRSFADSAKNYGGEVWLRPFHEMNGNWYPWGGTVGANTPAELVSAWRHVYQVFQERGATNVKFVWCANADSVPATTANQIAKYWPGDSYVDMVALDGYNWGAKSSWRSFGSVFGSAYKVVTSLTAKPVFIAETACNELGGSKAAWITDMFSSIRTTYSRIRGVVWFEANKECDWRIQATNASITAYRTAVAGGY